MSPDTVFQVANTFAALSWITMILFARVPIATRIVIPIGACGLLSFLYLYLIVTTLGHTEGGFDSLSSVSLLYQNRHALLAGWVHYLAFDMFIGCWEIRDARRHGISILLILPALFLTFLFGPVGLIAYLLIRFVSAHSVAIDEPENVPDATA